MINNFYYKIPSHILALYWLTLDYAIAKAKRLVEENENAQKQYRLKPFRCFHCDQRLVIMRTSTGSVLPVEIPEDHIPYLMSEKFDSKKHTSHLKKCIKLRLEWPMKQKKFLVKF
jgi:hypothetical protein